jgi:DNA-binding NarL/FixJ family response regulator
MSAASLSSAHLSSGVTALFGARDTPPGLGTEPEQTLLVVEETPEAQHRLSSILRQAFPHSTVIACSSVGGALGLIQGRFIDIALIELDLPDGSGVDVIRELSSANPLTRCVITTIFDDDAHVVPALVAGAMGYLLKDQSEAVLVEQLRLLAEGIPPLAPSVARRVVQYFAGPRLAAEARRRSRTQTEDDLARLSTREKQVLGLVAKGLQITDVARALEISANTVCSHVKSIYRKRKLCSRAEAALEARRLGLA